MALGMKAADEREQKAHCSRSASARLASWRAILPRWIGCAQCATTFGKSYRSDSETALSSTAIRRIACRTRSTFPSSGRSAPRYWRDSITLPPQRDRHVIPGKIELSPVLEAMGIAPEIGMGAVRFSLGRMTTRNEIDVVVERLTDVFAKTG